MYGPPSPSRLEPQFGFSVPNRRPLSLVTSSLLDNHDYSRPRTISQPPLSDKRATWAAPHSSSFSPISPLKRQSVLLPLPSSRRGIHYSSSAPPTPFLNTNEDLSFDADGGEPFGVTALSMRRRKHSPLFSPSTRNSLTGLVGSRFTSLMSSPQVNSDPRAAVQATLAARRYTCSHLLALRFPDSSSELEHFESLDEGYWEDVRSVISLLTSAFQNVTNGLNEMLEQHQLKVANDTHVESLTPNQKDSASFSEPSIHHLLTSESLSFAPMPNQFSRFAAHVDAISSALEEARSHLRQCVEALREDGGDFPSASEDSQSISGPLHAYEGLRRTLGYALRECERGKEPLRAILGEERKSVADQTTTNQEGGLSKVIESEMERPDEQFSSDDSDKTLYDHPSDLQDQDRNAEEEDDATGHLLDTASTQYLPLPGVEQVFEAESAPIKFNRPRSQLTREQRVALVKAQRKEGIKEPVNMPPRPLMGLGPGDDVVQELKDVIWKVGEQRRQLSSTCISAPVSISPKPVTLDNEA